MNNAPSCFERSPLHDTVWKINNFSAQKILREIYFGEFEVSKIAIIRVGELLPAIYFT